MKPKLFFQDIPITIRPVLFIFLSLLIIVTLVSWYSVKSVSSQVFVSNPIVYCVDSEELNIVSLGTERALQKTILDSYDQDHVRFAFLPDIHWGGSGDHKNNVSKAITLINEEDIDFVVLGGDNIGDGKDFIELDQLLQTLDVPYYWTFGNHDTPKQNIQAWLYCRDKGEMYTPYVWEGGGAEFVVLDSSFGEGKAEVSFFQLNVLRNMSKERPKILFLHHPVAGSVTNEVLYLKNRNELLSVIGDINTVAVLTGHDHWGKSIEEIDNVIHVHAPSVVSSDKQYNLNRPVTIAVGEVENGNFSVRFLETD